MDNIYYNVFVDMKPYAVKRLDLIAVKWLKRVIAFLVGGSVIAAIVGWGAILMGVKWTNF